MQDPGVTRYMGTIAEPQTPAQNRQVCLALLALVKLKTDHVFQPSPLASPQKLENFTGADLSNTSIPLETPRAMAVQQRRFHARHAATRVRIRLAVCSFVGQAF